MTRTRPMRRALLLAAPALAAALLAGGCTPTLGGTAAVVGGDRIKVRSVQDDAIAFLALVPGQYSEGDVQLLVLERDIYSKVLAKAALDAGVGASQTEIDRDRQTVYAAVGGRDGLVKRLAAEQQSQVVAPGQVEQWLRDRILFQKLATKVAAGGDPSSEQAQQAVGDALTRAAKSLHITLSPRYGEWTNDKGLVPQISGGLSKTTQELTGSPSPSATPAG